MGATRMGSSGSRRLLVAAALLLAPGAAWAQWAPQPFAPAAGSRWQVTTEDNSTDSRSAPARTRSSFASYDLTYVAREGAGYRIAYVMREVRMEGDSPSIKVAQAAIGAMKDIVIHALTDGAGKPVRVLNEAEVRAAVVAAGERMASPYASTPELVKLIRQIFDAMSALKGEGAAAAWLEPLPLLAEAQNTTLRPGMEHRSAGEAPSPFGGTLKSETVTRLAGDPKPDRYAVIATETVDPASLKEAIISVSRRLSRTGDGAVTQREFESDLPRIELERLKTSRVDVENGMARAARTEVTIRAGLAGQTGDRRQVSTVTVRPAP